VSGDGGVAPRLFGLFSHELREGSITQDLLHWYANEISVVKSSTVRDILSAAHNLLRADPARPLNIDSVVAQSGHAVTTVYRYVGSVRELEDIGRCIEFESSYLRDLLALKRNLADSYFTEDAVRLFDAAGEFFTADYYTTSGKRVSEARFLHILRLSSSPNGLALASAMLQRLISRYAEVVRQGLARGVGWVGHDSTTSALWHLSVPFLRMPFDRSGLALDAISYRSVYSHFHNVLAEPVTLNSMVADSHVDRSQNIIDLQFGVGLVAEDRSSLQQSKLVQTFGDLLDFADAGTNPAKALAEATHELSLTMSRSTLANRLGTGGRVGDHFAAAVAAGWASALWTRIELQCPEDGPASVRVARFLSAVTAEVQATPGLVVVLLADYLGSGERKPAVDSHFNACSQRLDRLAGELNSRSFSTPVHLGGLVPSMLMMRLMLDLLPRHIQPSIWHGCARAAVNRLGRDLVATAGEDQRFEA